MNRRAARAVGTAGVGRQPFRLLGLAIMKI
jgi:hypothetical protein